MNEHKYELIYRLFQRFQQSAHSGLKRVFALFAGRVKPVLISSPPAVAGSEDKQPDLNSASWLNTVVEGGGEGAFTPALLEIEKRPPAPLARIMAIVLMLVLLFALLWSFFSELDVVVTAPGKVVPSSRIKVIQPLEPGIVKAIHVRDGQAVKEGQVLVELDPTTTQADRNRIAADTMEARIEVARLTAQAEGQMTMSDLPPEADPTVVRTQEQILRSRLAEHQQRMAALEQEVARKRADRTAVAANVNKLSHALPLLEKRLKMKEELVKSAYVSEMAVIDNRLEVTNQRSDLIVQRARMRESEAGMSAAIKSRIQADAEFKSRTLLELAEARKRLQNAGQELIKAEQRKQQQTLVAPTSGIVQQLSVHTIGGVVTSAQPVLTIVPEGTNFEIEAQVLNKDIGFVRPGQDVVVKLDAFEYTKYGFLKGKMQWVGTDAIQDQKLGLFYPVRILVSTNRLPYTVDGRQSLIGAGMAVTSDIVISKRKVYEYFLAPLIRYKQESLRER